MVKPPETRPNERPQASAKHFRWGATFGEYEFSLQKITSDSSFALAIDHVSHEDAIIWIDLNDDQVYGLWAMALQHLVQRQYGLEGDPGEAMTVDNLTKALQWAHEQPKGHES